VVLRKKFLSGLRKDYPKSWGVLAEIVAGPQTTGDRRPSSSYLAAKKAGPVAAHSNR